MTTQNYFITFAMRKFLTLNTSLIILISLFLPSLAFANVCTKNCHPVTDDIQAFDDYLNGKFDPPLKEPWIPGNAINELLQKSLANAKKWHPDAYLVNFTYTYAPGSEDNYQFYWASPSNPTKMYEEKNSQSVGEEKDTIYKNPYGIFRVPLTMRRLTAAMLKSPTILPASTPCGRMDTKLPQQPDHGPLLTTNMQIGLLGKERR